MKHFFNNELLKTKAINIFKNYIFDCKSYYSTGTLKEEGKYEKIFADSASWQRWVSPIPHPYLGLIYPPNETIRKIGIWKYYNELGEFIKEEDFR